MRATWERYRHTWPIVVALIVPMWVALFVALTWYTDDALPIEVTHREFLNPVIPRGGTLYLRTEYVKLRECQTDVDRWVENERVVQLLSGMVASRPLGKQEWNAALQMPQTLPAGEYTYHIRFTWACNPMRNIIWNAPPMPFTIVED